jgi:DNA-binding transcriptional LysR family regulator
MDKLLAMTTFVRIVDGGSLTAASEALDKSLPSIVRMLASLEKSLGVRLLNRTTRRMTLTDEGRHYLERCRRILADIQEAELEISAQQSEPGGHLKVTASVMFGKMHIVPSVTDFLRRFDRVDIDLLLLDRVVNLVEEGIDIAIRIGHLEDSSLIAKPVGQIRRVVCGSPEYFGKNGFPKRPEQLEQHPCVHFTSMPGRSTWQFIEHGKPLLVHTKGSFSCNQAPAAIDACKAGLGIGMFYSYQIKPLVKQGKLIIVLEDFEPAPIPVHVVYSHAKLVSTRVRVFVDWITKTLREAEL